MRIAYLCDGEGCKASCRLGCYDDDGMFRCRRTTDPEHAINGHCEHPEQHHDRFVEVEPGVYIEKACENLPG